MYHKLLSYVLSLQQKQDNCTILPKAAFLWCFFLFEAEGGNNSEIISCALSQIEKINQCSLNEYHMKA